jgi:hypothetical protein
VKCIHCQTDSKKKDRADGCCPSCKHRFCFDPAAGDKLTDAGFLVLIERVSSNGTVRFTARNLYYEVVRRVQRRSKSAPWVAAIFMGVLALLGALVWPGFLLPAIGCLILLIHLRPPKVASMSYDAFYALLDSWNKTHGAPPGLIVRKEQRGEVRPLPSDIQHYSFDRAVVTDRPDTVDLLLANNFHFENNCAILTMGGYPQSAFGVVRDMLKNNPKLSVYVVHDASSAGCAMARRLASESWFQPTARIVDVGLTPAQARLFKGCWQPALGSSERAGWLAHYELELAAIRPEQIIKRLFRALSNATELPMSTDSGSSSGSDGITVFSDADAFSADASAADGGGDSFG